MHKTNLSPLYIYAYIRVSTELQSYESQKFEIDNWSRKRRMNRGDILICTQLSRLGSIA